MNSCKSDCPRLEWDPCWSRKFECTTMTNSCLPDHNVVQSTFLLATINKIWDLLICVKVVQVLVFSTAAKALILDSRIEAFLQPKIIRVAKINVQLTHF